MTSPRLSILVAMAKNRVIGKGNKLPWHLPADLKHFRALTMRHPIIMGRKTYESIGKPLPGRENIIVTHQKCYQIPGATVVNSIQDALQICSVPGNNQGESFIIGGSELYGHTLKLCQRMYITEIQKDFDGDVFFPEFNRDKWHESQREKHYSDENGGMEYHFVVLDRKSI